jgi:hypothetical protein
MAVVDGNFHSSTVDVVIPRSLYRGEGGYPHQQAEFGTAHSIPEGNLVVSMHYVNSTLCTDQEVEAAWKMKPAWTPPFGLMVDRSKNTLQAAAVSAPSSPYHCTFVQQVRQAQSLGAAAVVLANHLCECSNVDCIQNSMDATCETMPPILKDDGSGSDIHIPSVLLTKPYSQPMKQRLVGNDGPVAMEFQWHPYLSKTVSLTLWHTPFFLSTYSNPSQDMNGLWWKNLSQVVLALGDSLEFAPHFLLLDGRQLGCFHNNDACRDTCTNGGRYCDASTASSSLQAIQEIIIRMCLWKHAMDNGETDRTSWWKYVTYNAEHCHLDEEHSCREQALQEAGISSELIDSCLEDSGGWDKDNENSLLELALEEQRRHGVVINPTVKVNQGKMRERRGHDLSPASILDAVCDSFSHEYLPDACRVCQACPDPMACVAQSQPWTCQDHGNSVPTRKRKKHFRNLILWSLFLGGATFAYNKYRRWRHEQDLYLFFQNNRDYTVSENMFGEE